MHAQIHIIAFRNIETIATMVQIHISNGLLTMVMAGLTACRSTTAVESGIACDYKIGSAAFA